MPRPSWPPPARCSPYESAAFRLLRVGDEFDERSSAVARPSAIQEGGRRAAAARGAKTEAVVTFARSPLAACLLDLVERRAITQRTWLRETAAASDARTLETAFAETSRRVGAALLALADAERAALSALGVDWSLDAWGVDDAARAVWLLLVAERAAADLEDLIERRRRRGDARQRAALMRVLPLLPDARQWLAVALEARRGDVRAVLEALVCDNPYPAAHFHEVHFDDLVLAALDADLPLARMIGLGARVTERLATAAARVAASRRASGRRPPQDLWRLGWSVA